MASKNRTELLDYLAKGGTHTGKIKVSSALSRAGKYGGVGFTCVWAFYFLYLAFIFTALIIAAIAQSR